MTLICALIYMLTDPETLRDAIGGEGYGAGLLFATSANLGLTGESMMLHKTTKISTKILMVSQFAVTGLLALEAIFA